MKSQRRRLTWRWNQEEYEPVVDEEEPEGWRSSHEK